MLYHSPMPEVVGRFDAEAATAASKKCTPWLRRNELGKIYIRKKHLYGVLKTIGLEHDMQEHWFGRHPDLYVGKTYGHQQDASKLVHTDGVMSDYVKHRAVRTAGQINGASTLPTVSIVGDVEFREGEPIVDISKPELSRHSPLLSHGVELRSFEAQQDIKHALETGTAKKVRFEPGDVVFMQADTLHSTDMDVDLATAELPEYRLFLGQMLHPNYAQMTLSELRSQ